MTALTETILLTLIVLGASTFLMLWTLKYVQGEMIKATGIIIYGFCFVITVVNLVIEAFKASL